MIISDSSEIRRLLHMSSGADEVYVVIDNSDNVIMSNYGKHIFYKYAKNFNFLNCKNAEIFLKTIDGSKYYINCTILMDKISTSKKNNMGIFLSFTKFK